MWFVHCYANQHVKCKRRTITKVTKTINCLKTGTYVLVSAKGSEILKQLGCLYIYTLQYKQTRTNTVICLHFQSNARKIPITSGINQRSGFTRKLEQCSSYQRSCPSSTKCPAKTLALLCRACSLSEPGHLEADVSLAS